MRPESNFAYLNGHLLDIIQYQCQIGAFKTIPVSKLCLEWFKKEEKKPRQSFTKTVSVKKQHLRCLRCFISYFIFSHNLK